MGSCYLFLNTITVLFFIVHPYTIFYQLPTLIHFQSKTAYVFEHSGKPVIVRTKQRC